MAASHQTVGGLPNPSRTFADILQGPMLNPSTTTPMSSSVMEVNVDSAQPGLHRGFPALYFADHHVDQLIKPYAWTLIGKFSVGYNKIDPKLGRPSVADIHKYIQSLDLKSSFTVGLLDNRHVLIRLYCEEDYLRLYSRMVWMIGSVTMRIFKWTSDFNVDKESSLVPVWVTFSRLPIHFFAQSALFKIASLLGTPLRLDTATLHLKRPGVTRVQVKIDVLKERPHQIWIGVGSSDGFWQKVEFENVPSYCTHCWHVGHAESHCRIQYPSLKQQPKPTSTYVPKPTQSNPSFDPQPALLSTQQQQPTTSTMISDQPETASPLVDPPEPIPPPIDPPEPEPPLLEQPSPASLGHPEAVPNLQHPLSGSSLLDVSPNSPLVLLPTDPPLYY